MSHRNRTRPAARRTVCVTITVAFGLAAALALSGCRTKKADDGAAERARDTRPATVTVDGRDQYSLAAEIATAEKLPADERADRYLEIRRAWRGKRFRWRAYRIPALCASADACAVLPFDRGGADKRIVQGWMPTLALSAEAYAALEQTCGDHPKCAFEFEGELEQFVLSTEHLTRLAFRDVAIPTAPRTKTAAASGQLSHAEM